MADSHDWSSNANEAVKVRLLHADDKNKAVQFQPTFTYPIFGDEETIFGYRGLKIRLDYTADTLKPSLNVISREQYSPVGDTKADDVEGALIPFLPSLNMSGTSNSLAIRAKEANWEPPGELLHQYEAKGTTFGIWSTTLADAQAKEILKNIQIFVLFLIEGGSCIKLDDPEWTLSRWRVFFIYSIESSPSSPNSISYAFVGYSTAYSLFFLEKESVTSSTPKPPTKEIVLTFDDLTLQDKLPCRARISQFLILPPHQRAGHGGHLYNTMMDHLLAQPNTHEITVEDPNESFDDLRDYCDLIRLRANSTSFATLTINTDVALTGRKTQQLPTAALLSPTRVLQIQKAFKIASRQFSRLVEMQILTSIPARNRVLARLTRKHNSKDPMDRAYYYWRLLVKQRLYKFNVDTLAQLDLPERIVKLEETMAGLERDYIRILEGTEKMTAKIAKTFGAAETAYTSSLGPANGRAANNGAGPSTSRSNGNAVEKGKKRRVIDDDDDEDEDGDLAGAQTDGSSSYKRSKTVDA